MKQNELFHAVKKGYSRPNHRYVSRTYRNGRWYYTYDKKSGKSKATKPGASIGVKTEVPNVKMSTWKENDSDFDEKNYNERNHVSGTDFYIAKRPDGSSVILEEDMKWVIPAGVDEKKMRQSLKNVSDYIGNKRANGEKVDSKKWEQLVGGVINGTVQAQKKKGSNEMRMEDMSDNELIHYGVIGMKWGIRRYQPYGAGGYMPRGESEKVKRAVAKAGKAYAKADANPSSKRLAKKANKAGAKAYLVTKKANAKAEYREKKHKEYLEKEKEYKKKEANKPKNAVKNMSDEDLNKAVNRLRKEQEYVKLVSENTTLSEHADAFIAGTLATFGTVAVTTLASKGGQAATATFLKRVLDPKVFSAIYKK